MNILEIAHRFGLEPKKKTANEYSSPCPFCGGEDRFCLFLDSNRFWCRHCNKKGDGIALLREKEGMSFQEAKAIIEGGNGSTPRATQSNNTRQVAAYDYTDESGALLYQVIRYEPKTFKQRRPNGKGWKWGLGDVRRVLYKLPELLKADSVFLVEGEKDADLLNKMGIVATTNLGGAGKWPKLDSEWNVGASLAGKSVYIIPDNDDEGRKHSEAVAAALHGKAKQAKIVSLPGLHQKGDVSDFVKIHGHEKALSLLHELSVKASVWSPPKKIVFASELLSMQFENIPQIIDDGILTKGGCLMLAGESGLGKSLIRTELAVHLVMGWDCWGLRIPGSASIHIIQAENTLQQENFRLRRMLEGLEITGFPDRLSYATRNFRIDLNTKRDQETLLEMVKEAESEVIIYDPLTSFHGANENDNVQIRRVLDSFTEINGKLDTTTIVIHHFGKPNPDQDISHRTRGASAIRDWCDTLIALTNKAHEHKIMRLMSFIKVRNGPQRKAILLERDEYFLHHPIEEDVLCPASMVRDLLVDLGGRVDNQADLRNAIMGETGCKERSARSFIKNAVETGYIKETDQGRAKGYVVWQ